VSSTPVIVVTGVAEEPMARTTMGLQWDLPSAVVVRHVIDARTQVLTRTVSDLSGIIEREDIDLEHACVSCAIREDIVPSLQRLTSSSRWDAVIAHLPVTAEATQVCRVVAWAGVSAPQVSIAAVVSSFDAATVVEDVLGDDLVGDRGLSTSPDDSRGVAEVAAAMIEYSDVVAVLGDPERTAHDLVRVIAPPRAQVVTDASMIDTSHLLTGVHEHGATEQWVAEVRRGPLPPVESGDVWRLDLRTDRPFHPERLYEQVESIGGGPRRSRGCFWLPSRPDEVCAWDGAGGQLSIGSDRTWDRTRQLTRIVVVGLDDGAADVEKAFRHCVLSDAEMAGRGPFWEVDDDGLEPWLGEIRRAA
jgi:G3E family GTPase